MNLKSFFFIITALLIIPGLVWFKNEWIKDILGAYSFIVFAYTLFLFLLVLVDILYNFYDWYVQWISIKKLKQTNNKPKKSKHFYVWLINSSFDEKYFYDILSGFSVDNLLMNLKVVKEKLKEGIGEDIGDYYLLRNFLENVKSEINSFSTIVKSFIIPIIATGITFILAQSIAKNEMTDMLVYFLTFPNSLSFPFIISYTLIAVALIMVITRGVKSIFKLTTLKERRINSILFVLNSIISEMEHTKKNDVE
ncbi:hypothetical protein [Psychrobacillus sp.]|uniref:hypothetical protein n=1 Tax=Psychrobacillus sp. TaxID=1871623 RepID=UPI0028BD8926|nr:hypothetical protein [Psychrobacillus sp.]